MQEKKPLKTQKSESPTVVSDNKSAPKADVIKKAQKAAENLEKETLYGIRSDDDFQKHTADVDWDAIFDESVIKHLEKALRSGKKPEDLIPEVLFAVLMVPLLILREYLKRKNKALKEAREKNAQEKEKAIKEALKDNKLSKLSLIVHVAHATQKFLTDFSMLPFDNNGKIQEDQLTPYQKAHYKKYLFVSRLPRTADGAFDFRRFTSAQKKQYTRWVMAYATKNPTFRQYLNQMAAAYVPKEKFKELGAAAARMSIESRGPVYRTHHQHIRSA